MKYLKLFESFKDIDSICEKYGITNYTINNGLVDVDGYVNLSHRELTKLPIKFGKVNGYFDCSENQLRTLEGSPKELNGHYFNCMNNQLTSLRGSTKEVNGDYYCNNNQLISLDGGPTEVSGYFDCDCNQLTSLDGGPLNVGGSFDCNNNKLTSLRGFPNSVGGNFSCRNNKLTSLEGTSKELGGFLICHSNPISVIYDLFDGYMNTGGYKRYLDSLDYNYLRGTNIIKSRFQEALDEIGKTAPVKIEGYNYI